ncbi:Nlrc3 [Symbiodinium sp. CCMP2592]|nr:Nlrc3 [Symbiodinium sp. CCMP2592]
MGGCVWSKQETSLTELKDLHRFLADADIRLVRFGFLQALLREGRLWPRRQEAEHETFWHDWRQESLSALVAADDLYIAADRFQLRGRSDVHLVSVSHCWEAQQHPDPWGFQLKSLVSRVDAEFGTLLSRRGSSREVLLFVDFICLPQYLRTEPEQARFKCAMNSMHLLYAHDAFRVWRLEELTPQSMKRSHPSTIDIYSDDAKRLGPQPFEQLILNTTPYQQRGWCVAETQWMATHAMVTYAPMIPERFRERVRAEGKPSSFDGLVLRFTHRSDAEPVMQLQEKIFELAALSRKRAYPQNLDLRQVLFLAEALQRFEKLKILNLGHRNNVVGDEGAVALAWGIMACPLEVLDLEGCQIGARGAAAIAGFCHDSKTLQKLDMDKNPIGEEGAIFVAGGLAANTTIRDVFLRGCEIGPIGADALAELLCRKSMTLCNIVLCDNPFGEEGAVALASGLRGSPSVKFVWIQRCQVGPGGATALSQLCREMKRSFYLNALENPLSDEGRRLLEEISRTSKHVRIE